MPIEPKRIEAAARAIAGFGPEPDYDGAWAEAKKWPFGKMCLKQAADALASAYPEFASDPPAAWVAPIDTNAEALQERLDQLHERMARQFGLMADAYTKEQT